MEVNYTILYIFQFHAEPPTMSGIVRERVGSLYMFTSFPDESLLIGYSAVLDKETKVQLSVQKFAFLSLFCHTKTRSN